MAKIELKGIEKRYGAQTIIPALDLCVESGEFVALVGPSGCGKSTTLRIIAGLEDCDRGTVLIDGKSVNSLSAKDRGVAMVFQNYALYPHMSVSENLGFALKMARVPVPERERRIQETARILGLGPLLGRKPSQLSGGQKQRVAMGRAMIRQPKVLLFDEPLSNLDAQLRVKMRSEIAALHRKLRSTVVYVTHDQVEAMTLADRIAVLNLGHLEQMDAPMVLYHRPKTRFVASFIGTPPMNLLAIQAQGGEEKLKTLGFRPEATRFVLTRRPAEHDPGLLSVGQGKVQWLERLGGMSYIHLLLEDQWVIAESRQENPPGLGDDVEVWVERRAAYFFDGEGRARPAPENLQAIRLEGDQSPAGSTG